MIKCNQLIRREVRCSTNYQVSDKLLIRYNQQIRSLIEKIRYRCSADNQGGSSYDIIIIISPMKQINDVNNQKHYHDH